MIFHVFILIFTAAACSVAPGFAIIRHLHWRPAETFVASVAASLFLVYTAAFALFIAGVPVRYDWLITATGAVITLTEFRGLARLFAHRQVRRILLAFLAVYCWTLLLTLPITNFSGGGYIGDWLDQYQRSLFFTGHIGKFAGPYSIPARPPMMNVLAAFAMSQTSSRFEIFQLVYGFLNALIFLPCPLIARRVAPRRSRPTLLAMAAVMLSPLFVTNALYTWSKLLPGLYILLAIHLYWPRPRTRPMLRIATFASLAIGFLVHYSVGPYAVALGLHYAFTSLRQRRLPEFFASAAISLLIIVPWFAWSILHFGPHTTFASNTAVTDAAQYDTGQNARKVAMNVLDSFIPHPLTPEGRDAFSRYFVQHSSLGTIRDHFFLLYQGNVVFAVGIIAGPLLCLLLVRDLRRSRYPFFWIGFITVTVILGIAVHGERVPIGLAGICLQPLAILGSVYIAARFPSLPLLARGVFILGRAVDLSVGILLHVYLQSLEIPASLDPTGRLMASDTFALSRRALVNYRDKLREHLVFLGDHFNSAHTALLIAAALIGALAILLTAAAKDPALNPPRSHP